MRIAGTLRVHRSKKVKKRSIGTEPLHELDVAYQGHAAPACKAVVMTSAHAFLLQRLSKLLHAQYDAIANEPLPQRWIDLIRDLNEKERAQATAHQPEPHAPAGS